MIVRTITAMLVVCLTAIPVASCQTHDSGIEFTDLDNATFAGVLMWLTNESSAVEVRVDPRPLSNSEDLVTLRGRVDQRSDSTTQFESYFFNDSAGFLQKRRVAELSEFNLRLTNAEVDDDCQGVLVPPPPPGDTGDDPHAECPSTQFKSVIISVPRAVDKSWTFSIGERTTWSELGKQIAVRTLEVSVSPNGSVATAVDYFFEVSTNQLEFVSRKLLMRME